MGGGDERMDDRPKESMREKGIKKKKKKRVKIEAQKQNEVESKRGAVKFVRLKVEIQMKTASTTRDEAGKHEND